MKSRYHIEITQKALDEHFSQDALETIIQANIRQDRISYQFKHDYIHFDGNAFESGFRYIADQKDILIASVNSADFITARKALGHICHSWQDYYSHSNYVKLWLEINGASSPQKIGHDDKRIMDHPELRSGINYGLTDLLALLPILGKFVKPLMPADSHAKMNLDSPQSGFHFGYAYYAALKRTEALFENLIIELENNRINAEKIAGFTDQ